MTARSTVDARFDALFDPRGVIVAGASTHPGKFGFVALHNILRHGYAGKVFATNRRRAATILGVDTRAVGRRPPRRRRRPRVRVHAGARRTPTLLRACAAQGRAGRVRR